MARVGFVPRSRGTRRLLHQRKERNLESGAFDRTSLPGQVAEEVDSIDDGLGGERKCTVPQGEEKHRHVQGH